MSGRPAAWGRGLGADGRAARPRPPRPRSGGAGEGGGRSEYVSGAARSQLGPRTARAPGTPDPSRAGGGLPDYCVPRTTITCALQPRPASPSPPSPSTPKLRILLDRSGQIPTGLTCPHPPGSPDSGHRLGPGATRLDCTPLLAPDLLGSYASLPRSAPGGPSLLWVPAPPPARLGPARSGPARLPLPPRPWPERARRRRRRRCCLRCCCCRCCCPPAAGRWKVSGRRGGRGGAGPVRGLRGRCGLWSPRGRLGHPHDCRAAGWGWENAPGAAWKVGSSARVNVRQSPSGP